MNRPRETTAARLSDTLTRNYPDLLRYLGRRLPHDDAADALADLMMTAWRRIAKLPGDDEGARMWLFGIARNVIITSQRTERRRQSLTDQLRAALATAPRDAQPADEGADVRDAIERLAPEQAELVRLIHWDGFTITDAGQILGINPSTARTRYQRARDDLRTALEHRESSPAHNDAATGVAGTA
ncbi:RNA polymerase sigma factor [Clavibacter michiganensis]|uniref:RNA polymerase sigma factor n=1 Tax=Clavibacter michiganensis TaxID=28447 RepID=UPI0021582032|nr:RNA polymerase sigma factor [Clavibacter michiganensis]